MKLNKLKFIRFILIVVMLVLLVLWLIDFVKYTEMYITTWKYQLNAEILNGEQQAIDLYERVYVVNNKDLFDDNFEIRNTYLHTDNNEISDNSITDIFIITAYCKENYPHICNDGDSTYTSTGTNPTSGRTVAVDPNIIPYGTRVDIEGVGTRIAEDCGGAIKGNRIDLLFDSHEEALEFGIQTKEVTIYYD